MSSPIVHFAAAATGGEISFRLASAAEFSLVERRRPKDTVSFFKRLVVFGLFGTLVDLDHIPQMIGHAKFLVRNGFSEHRPLHGIIFIFAIFVVCLFTLLISKVNSSTSNKKLTFYAFGLGIGVAVLTHYIFDYLLICWFTNDSFICYKVGLYGQKLKEVIRLGPGP